jgi:nucleolar protein 56
MQRKGTLVVARWDAVHVVREGKLIDSIPIEGDKVAKLKRKLDGKEIEEERSALEKYPGSALASYHVALPRSPEDRDSVRELAFAVAERALACSFTGDEDIIWSVRVLDEMKEQFNTLKEMATGWELVHSLSKTESEGVANLNTLVKEMEKTINRIDRFVEERMRQVAPSVCEACGPILGARLIESANGLIRLAMKPSSAVQVMGAEKALFRHLKTGAPPPKHGLIFLHPSIQGAPRRERGRKSRALAAKISMAARRDAFVTGKSAPCE